MAKMTIEERNLIKELNEWVIHKEVAIQMVVLLITKFDIRPQDFVDELKKSKENNNDNG